MALNVDMGGNSLYVTDVFVGDTASGLGLTGTSVSTTLGSVSTTLGNIAGVTSTTGPGIISGPGAPTSTAPHGTLYINTTGATVSTRMYINTTGVSTWTAFTTLA